MKVTIAGIESAFAVGAVPISLAVCGVDDQGPAIGHDAVLIVDTGVPESVTGEVVGRIWAGDIYHGAIGGFDLASVEDIGGTGGKADTSLQKEMSGGGDAPFE